METISDSKTLLFTTDSGKATPFADPDLAKHKLSIQDSDRENQFNGLKQIKKMMLQAIDKSDQLNQIIQDCIDSNIFEDINNIINTKFDDFDLLFEGVWIIINACCGTQEKVDEILKTDILTSLTRIIQEAIKLDDVPEKFISVAHHCVWVIGNIATDSMQHRDACLEKDLANLIVSFNKKHMGHDQLVETGTWALSRLVDKKPAPFWNQIETTLPFFISMLEQNISNMHSRDALWGIYYLSNSYLLNIVDAGVIPLVIKYLDQGEITLSFPALKVLGNIISSNRDTLTDEVLKNKDVLLKIINLFTQRNETVKVYAGWTLGNLAAGNPDQIAKILEEPKFLETLGECLHDANEKIKYQASCAIANLVSRATNDQIQELVTKHNYLDHLASLMKEKHLEIYERNIIEPLHKVMKADTTKTIAPIFQNKGLVEQMKSITGNLGFEMRGLADNVIRQHFTTPTPSLFSFSTGTGTGSTLFGSSPAATHPITILPATSAPTTASSSIKKSASSKKADSPKKVPRAPKSKKIQKPRLVKKQETPSKVTKAQAKISVAKSPVKELAEKKAKKVTSPSYMRVLREGKRAGLRRKFVAVVCNSAIRRTNTIDQVVQEAQSLIEGVNSRTRPRKMNLSEKVRQINKKKVEQKRNEREEQSGLLKSSRKIRRTNSMKQTLGEAKKILKQIDSQIKSSVGKLEI